MTSSSAADLARRWTQLPLTVWLLILLALAFDFLNGFHDAANSIATVVSTRVLSPQWAVVWAAFFNFIAFLVFPLKVAGTHRQGHHRPSLVTIDLANYLIAATLIAACAGTSSPGISACRPAPRTP